MDEESISHALLFLWMSKSLLVYSLLWLVNEQFVILNISSSCQIIWYMHQIILYTQRFINENWYFVLQTMTGWNEQAVTRYSRFLQLYAGNVMFRCLSLAVSILNVYICLKAPIPIFALLFRQHFALGQHDCFWLIGTNLLKNKS